MPTGNPTTFLGQSINLDTSPFGQIVNQYYLDGANDANPDVVKLAADVNGSVVASKFHMDYTKVLEDSLTDKFSAIDVAIAGAGAAPSLTAIYRLDTNVDPTINATMRTLVAKVQLLEHFCLLLNQGLRLSSGGRVLPQGAGDYGSLPFCINQITQSEPALAYDLAVQSFDCPPINDTALSTLAVPEDATAYAGTSINFADLSLGVVTGYDLSTGTLTRTFTNSGTGYTFGTSDSNTSFQVQYNPDFTSMGFIYDELSSTGKNLSKIILGLTKTLTTAPNKLFTSAGFSIKFEALGAGTDFTVNPVALNYSATVGTYSTFKTLTPFADPADITSNVRVITAFTNSPLLPMTKSGLDQLMVLEAFPGYITGDSHCFSYTKNTDTGNYISISTLEDQDLNPALDIATAIRNSFTLATATLVFTDASDNVLTLTLTNTLPDVGYIHDGWLTVVCTDNVLTAINAVSGFNPANIKEVTYQI